VEKGQEKIDAHETAISKLTADAKRFGEEATALGQNAELKKKDEAKWKTALDTAQAKASEAQAEIASRKQQQAAIKKQMDSAQKNKDAVFGSAQSPAAPTARPRATDGKGNFMEWNGSAWVKVAK
jgi:hypothetical protein